MNLLLATLCLSAVLAPSCTAFGRRITEEDFPIGWGGETFEPSKTFIEGAVEAKHVWVSTLSWSPRAFLYHNFMTADECDHLISLAKEHMEKSMVVDNESGKAVPSDVRTSSGYFLQRSQDPVVKRIEERIAEFTKLPVENGEALHILEYKAGEEYRPHYDYFHDQVNTKNGGQRVATMLLYLSDVESGGETVFPASHEKPTGAALEGLSECGQKGVAVRPRKGDGLLFYSLKPDGALDTSSLHSGCPVIKGDKWSATKWIRQGRYSS